MRLRPRFGPRTFVLVLAVGLTALELGLYHIGGYGRAAATEPDARLGWRKIPGQVRTGESGIEVRINSFGYRDREWDPPSATAAENGLCIAIQGDSATFGAGVSVQETWGRVLERRIRERNAAAGRERDALVMNFAVPGYVFEQMAGQYEDDVRGFRPELVVVAVNAWSARPMKFVPRVTEYPLRRWIQSRAIYDWVQRELVGEHGIGLLDAEERHELLETESELRRDPFAPEHAGLWLAMEDRLARWQRELEASGGRLVLVSMPTVENLTETGARWVGERWALWCSSHPGAIHVDPLPACRAAMAELLLEIERRGLGGSEVWKRGSLPPVELEHADRTLWFFSDPVHLTPRGHAVLAQAVVQALAAAGAL